MPVTHIHSLLQKSFTSTGVKDRHHVTAEMKRLKKDNPGDVDLDLIQTSKLLSSSAAKHRISVAPSNRRPSKKARARTPQKRSSSRLDDVPSPIAEEPTTPSKSPAPFDLDSELPFPGVALSMSAPSQQHSNGSSLTSKPKAGLGLGPMVLPPILPPFGPKGSRSRKIESTPPSSDFKSSTSSGLPADSAIVPTLEDRSEETGRGNDKIENQKNGVARGKGRHEDVEKLLDVDPTLFGDSDKLRNDDSTKKVGGDEGKGEMTFELEGDGLGLMETGIGGKEDSGDREGLGIADLDLLVDLPDPLDLGKNMFGVETILEEDEEEEEAGHEMDESDDFLEDESSTEEVEVEEEVKEKVKVGTVAAMINNVEVEIRKSPSPPGERRENCRETVEEMKKKEEAKNTLDDDDDDDDDDRDVEVTKKDKLSSSLTEDESKTPSAVATKSIVDDVAVVTETNNDKDDDNDDDVNDSNYPGNIGTPLCEESINGTTTLACKDEEKGDTPKNEGVPVVIIESPSSDDLKISRDSTLEDAEEEEDEEPMILPPVPKEVIIIMKDDPKKDPEAEAKPTTPTTPEPPAIPVEAEAPEEDVPTSPPPTEMKKKEEVEKESSETEKDVEEIKKKKEEEDAAIVEERRLSVAASKALFEAKIPASEPVKSTSSNKVVVNGNGTSNANARRSSQPTETVPETKAEADTKLSEKEEKKDEAEGEKDEAVFSDKEENLEMEESKEEPVSLRDRISRYQSLATKTPVKGLTSHVPSRNSPTKQRPASTSNIENKDSPKKIAPKAQRPKSVPESSKRVLENEKVDVVLSKPSSTSSNKPSGSTATTIEPSRPSTNPTPSSTSTSTTRKPLQPKIDRCMVCDKPVYPNEMSKFEGRVFHRTCQKCSECSRSLTLWNLDIAEDRLYCKQHGTVAKNNQLKEKLII